MDLIYSKVCLGTPWFFSNGKITCFFLWSSWPLEFIYRQAMKVHQPKQDDV